MAAQQTTILTPAPTLAPGYCPAEEFRVEAMTGIRFSFARTENVGDINLEEFGEEIMKIYNNVSDPCFETFQRRMEKCEYKLASLNDTNLDIYWNSSVACKGPCPEEPLFGTVPIEERLLGVDTPDFVSRMLQGFTPSPSSSPPPRYAPSGAPSSPTRSIEMINITEVEKQVKDLLEWMGISVKYTVNWNEKVFDSSAEPSSSPSGKPSSSPSIVPSSLPSIAPSLLPSIVPSEDPLGIPSTVPSHEPREEPSNQPSLAPSPAPTNGPTLLPTLPPTLPPTVAPTNGPTLLPTLPPSAVPTSAPTSAPTSPPTAAPTAAPTNVPTLLPTLPPTAVPTSAPTSAPTPVPTPVPTAAPSAAPSAAPTSVPSNLPSTNPSAVPS
jgi:hypothetical protein